MGFEHRGPEHLVLAVDDYALILLVDPAGHTEIHGNGPAALTPLVLRTIAETVERDLIGMQMPEEPG